MPKWLGIFSKAIKTNVIQLVSRG